MNLSNPDWIRGSTIRQPWTTCILAGKDVENRPRPWPGPAPVCVTASRPPADP